MTEHHRWKCTVCGKERVTTVFKEKYKNSGHCPSCENAPGDVDGELWQHEGSTTPTGNTIAERIRIALGWGK